MANVKLSVESEPNGERVAFGCRDGNVRIWDTQKNTLQVLRSERVNESISAVHWSPDGRLLAALRSQQWIHGNRQQHFAAAVRLKEESKC